MRDIEKDLRTWIEETVGHGVGRLGPEELAGLVIFGIVVVGLGWLYAPHVAVAAETVLVEAAPVIGCVAGVGVLALAGQAAVRVVATRRMARSRRTFLVQAAESPSREALETFMRDLVSCRRRVVRWIDWRATAFRMVRTNSRAGVPVVFWEVPEVFVPTFMKAVSEVRGVRLIAQAKIPQSHRPVTGHGRVAARLELEPANEVFAFGDPGADAYRRWAWTLSRVDLARGERLMEVTDVLPVPPGERERRRRRVLESVGHRLDRLRDRRSPIAGSIERQIAIRGLKERQDDSPRFVVQILVRAEASERARAAQLLESVYSNWDQWAGPQNHLRARGRIVMRSAFLGGADAPIRRWWFDMRLNHGLFGGSGRTVTAREFAAALRPWRAEDVPPAPATEGWHICTTDDDRRVVLAPDDFAYNVHCIGSIGKGKTTALERKVLEDIDHHRAVVYIDFKGDSAPRILERVGPEHVDRVRYVDSTRSDYSVGLNVLDCPAEDLHDVVADHVLGCFARIFGDTWKYRQEEIARAVLLTQMRHPGTTLPDMPVILTNTEVRRRVTSGLRDPVLRMFWAWFEGLSEAERERITGPLLAKLRFLLRRPVRRMLGQPKSTVDLQELFDAGGVLILRLPKGKGEMTAPLLGALWVIQVWQAIMRRGPGQDHPVVSLVVDECQNVLSLIPATFAELLAEDRGYRLGVWLAHQYLGQLGEEARQAIQAVVLTLVVFELEFPADARALGSRLAPLADRDLLGLGRFRVAAKVCRDGRAGAALMGTTLPLQQGAGAAYAETVAVRSLERWGRRTADVDAEIERRLGGAAWLGDQDLDQPDRRGWVT